MGQDQRESVYGSVVRRLAYRTKVALLAASGSAPRVLGSVHQLFELGRFVNTSKLRSSPYFSDRRGLYEHVQATLIGAGAIDYLEFGVYHGASMRCWVEINRSPASRFFGFDTFEGLPEAYQFGTGTMEAGRLSTGGRTPDIPDSRVRFIKGLFQETLGDFLQTFQSQSRIVVHCDADLYTSTLYVLAKMDEILAPGSIILFDEFGSVDNEFRAFLDYSRAFRKEFSPIAHAGRLYEQAAFIAHE